MRWRFSTKPLCRQCELAFAGHVTVSRNALAVVRQTTVFSMRDGVRWTRRRFLGSASAGVDQLAFLSRALTDITTNSRPKDRSLAHARQRPESVVALRWRAATRFPVTTPVRRALIFSVVGA